MTNKIININPVDICWNKKIGNDARIIIFDQSHEGKATYEIRINFTPFWAQHIIHPIREWLSAKVAITEKDLNCFDEECKLIEKIKMEKYFQKQSVNCIVNNILIYHGISKEKIYEKGRSISAVNARFQVIYFVSKYVSKMVLEDRAKIFDFTHPNVLYALKQVNNRIETEQEYRLQIIELDGIIKLALIELNKP